VLADPRGHGPQWQSGQGKSHTASASQTRAGSFCCRFFFFGHGARWTGDRFENRTLQARVKHAQVHFVAVTETETERKTDDEYVYVHRGTGW